MCEYYGLAIIAAMEKIVCIIPTPELGIPSCLAKVGMNGSIGALPAPDIFFV